MMVGARASDTSMGDLSYEDGDGPDPRSLFALPNHWQYQRAILQEETGEEDLFEGDSEVELCGRFEES